MKASDIADVYKTRFKKISKYYHKLLEHFGANDIHHFRVEIKKLKAFIRYVNLAMPEQQQKIPKELKKLYSIAGNIRNLQLHQRRLTNLTDDLLMESPSFYLQHLADQEQKMQKEARRIAEKISIKDFEKKLVDSVPDDVDKSIKNVFVHVNRQRLEALLSLPFYYDEALHDIRKVLKDLMYDYKYLTASIDVEIPSGVASLKAMEQLTSALGDFHDLCIALFLLSPVYLDQTPLGAESDKLNELKAQLKLRKEAMKDEIVRSLVPVKQEIEKQKSLVLVNELLY